jgi:hypothetical protein
MNSKTMKLNLAWSRILIATAILLGVILLGYWLIKPLWLTQTYGPKLKDVVQKYNEALGTVAGWKDPAVAAQVATGKNLDYLVQTRCRNCPSVAVFTKVDVQILQVLDYSPTTSKVLARIGEGWHEVSPSTGQVLGPCHAQAYTVIHILVQEGGVWKISDGEPTDRAPVDDSPELLAKYCGSN